MRLLLLAALFLTCLPAATRTVLSGEALAQVAPSVDEDGCEALATKMDDAVKAGRKPTEEQQDEYERCITFFSCDAVSEASEAGKVPREVASTNFKMMHYVNVTCGHLH